MATAQTKKTSTARKASTAKKEQSTNTIFGNFEMPKFDTANLTKGADNVIEFQKANIDAIFASAEAAITGAEALNKRAFEYAKATIDARIKAYEALIAAEDVKAAYTSETEYLRAAYEELVAEGKAMVEEVTDLVKSSVEPLTGRAKDVVEKAKAS